MTVPEIAAALKRLGCPPEKCRPMASQLDRRARMDAAKKGVSYESVLRHLLGLMAQGWANPGGQRQSPIIRNEKDPPITRPDEEKNRF